MPSNLEHIEIESKTNKEFQTALLTSPAGAVEAVLGVEVVDHDSFNQTVIGRLHATDANQKVEELLSVLERATIGGGLLNKEGHDGLHSDFPTGAARKRIDYYLSHGVHYRSTIEFKKFYGSDPIKMTNI